MRKMMTRKANRVLAQNESVTLVGTVVSPPSDALTLGFAEFQDAWNRSNTATTNLMFTLASEGIVQGLKVRAIVDAWKADDASRAAIVERATNSIVSAQRLVVAFGGQDLGKDSAAVRAVIASRLPDVTMTDVRNLRKDQIANVLPAAVSAVDSPSRTAALVIVQDSKATQTGGRKARPNSEKSQGELESGKAAETETAETETAETETAETETAETETAESDAPVSAPESATPVTTSRINAVAERQADMVPAFDADIQAVADSIRALGFGKFERLAMILSGDMKDYEWKALHAAFDVIALEWSERAELATQASEADAA